jgi:hypothetical protein
MKSINTEDAWSEMDELFKSQAKPEGDGWFNSTEFASRYGLLLRHANYHLNSMLKKGLVEKWGGGKGAHTMWRIKP